MVGSNKLPEKERRRFRRANHIARDLRTPKYKQRVVGSRTKDDLGNWSYQMWPDKIEDYDD